jgi:hypothetical protein
VSEAANAAGAKSVNRMPDRNRTDMASSLVRGLVLLIPVEWQCGCVGPDL